MNNIYKVIWSKAKNCYVVVSEIARSHTKSASGSEKIGGVARHALLALGAACAIACGGFGNVGAAETVEVTTTGSSTATVYTKEGTESYVQTNTYTRSQTYTQAQVKKLINDLKTGDVATNKNNITTLEGKTVGLSTDGKSLNGMNSVETGALTVTGQISNGAGVNTTLTAINDSIKQTGDNKTAIDKLNEKTAEISHEAGGGTNISGVKIKDGNIVGNGNSAITGLTNVGTLSINGKNLEGNMVATDKDVEVAVKAETDAREVADTALGQRIDKEIQDREAADTALEGKINEESKAREAKDKELRGRIGTVDKDGNYIKNSNTNNVSQNVKVLDAQVKVNEETIAAEKAEREATDTKLEGEITKNSEDIKELNAKVKTAQDDIAGLKAKDMELEGKIKNNADNIQVNKDAIAATDKRTGGITRNDAATETTIEGHVTVDNLGNVKAKGNVTADGKLTGKGVDAGDGAITTTGAVNAGSLIVENASNLKGDVTMDKTLSVTGDTSLKKTDVDGALNVTGESSLKNTEVGGTLGVTGATTLSGELTAEKNATFEKDVTVDGTTNLKDTTVTGDLKVTGTITTDKMVFGDKATNNYTEIDKGHITSKNDVLAGDATKKSSSMELDHTKLEVGVTDKDSKGHLTMTADQTSIKNSDLDGKNYSEIVADKDRVTTTVKDEKENATSTKSSATEIRNYAKDAAGNKTNNVQTATQNKSWAKDKDGNESSIVQTGKDITNTAQNGTITNDAQNIVNNASGDMTNTVGGKLTTTVTGQATENFNGGLNTTVKGTENHTVNGKQINTVTEGQENIISGGQTNTITGGQINNITGNQTTTITGNKTETVTENVTEDYQKNLTTTVGGNEIHEVKGTKTETVEGKLTENFKGGQETNVTGDQTTNVSGTQTTTATDINRNASSGMIDTIDNDYGTNTETKVAGKTTTDVSIKGTVEKGKYIRGANESRDYLIKGTLTNTETKTAEATSTEIIDGTNKASTRQDAKNLAGSVTNGTETGVSGIHANDDGSVSIDSAVVGGGMSSVINQKKDSIQSAVGDGTNSTVIHQDKDNVTIASSNGMVGLVGKDIVNNAKDTITNTAGTKITDTAGDSSVVTEKGKGTTFTKTGSTAYSTAAGAPTDTNIAGNHITTGRVDANELGVSDKDGNNSADLSVKAGEGVKASASDGATTGSLDVTAEEVGSSVTDASGKGSTFKQRIDAIMMESKNVSITAEGTLTKEAKDIVTNASNSITEKVGDTNVTEKTTTSSKSEIQNADTITSVQQTENMVQSYVGKKDLSATNVTTNSADASANAVTKDGQTSTVLNNKDGLLIRNTANGSSFTTADGTNTGRASEWTNVKGNEISTGKVEANYVKMDYADVMRDLGVRGNANINGKTTTGSLEVTGTSTLKGDVTMESNATVKKDLTVEGNTTTETLNVTKNAEVGGELKVVKKATFEDSVSIAKDLSVGGDVTANSYKVGDKTYISADGINANDQKITNVADGSISEGSKDAVNGGQLYQVKNDLEGKVNKVGANAAAMANLHPMEFDPDSKWNIAAAMGNYGSETATAIGAFYRPNEDVMVNFSTAFGTGENMVGGGVSVRLGKGGNKLSREETNALKAQVNDLTARMDALLSVLNPNMSKDFPDVPENHWAYEAVSRLAGNDIVQGYPDGEFHGERTMTRYEMAEIIYNALSRGAEAEKELVEEFKPELQAMAASEKATAERAEG